MSLKMPASYEREKMWKMTLTKEKICFKCQKPIKAGETAYEGIDKKVGKIIEIKTIWIHLDCRGSINFLMPAPCNETDFQDTIIDAAHLCRWSVAHFRPAMTRDGSWSTPVSGDGKGFPDLFLAKPGHRAITAEVKSESGKLTPEQIGWGELLKVTPGIRYFVWCPSDWESIQKLLQEKDWQVQ